MSEQDNFDAAVKQMGVREHLDLCIRPGLGSTGLYWESRNREGALLAEKWKSLRGAALTTSHAELNAADLNGLMVGEAFLEFVTRDPKVLAAGAWLCAERPVYQEISTGFPRKCAEGSAALVARTGRSAPISATPN